MVYFPPAHVFPLLPPIPYPYPPPVQPGTTMTGGVAFGGSATMTAQAAGYMLMSGGLKLGGTAGQSWTQTVTMDGGLALGGAADLSASSGMTMDGGLALGGAADLSASGSMTMDGGLALGGAAGQSWTQTVTMDGGLKLGGAATMTPTTPCTPPTIPTTSHTTDRNTATFAVTFPAGTTAGNRIYACQLNRSAVTPPAPTGGGGSWTQVSTLTMGASLAFNTLTVWESVYSSGASCTFSNNMFDTSQAILLRTTASGEECGACTGSTGGPSTTATVAGYTPSGNCSELMLVVGSAQGNGFTTPTSMTAVDSVVGSFSDTLAVFRQDWASGSATGNRVSTLTSSSYWGGVQIGLL